ncbi:hypothetical protein HOF65_01210, partial [bacterium]|nr:hypothetical protein [bacterium]
FSTHVFAKSSKAIIQNTSVSFHISIGVFQSRLNFSISFSVFEFIFSNNFLLPSLILAHSIFQTIHFPFISSKSSTSNSCIFSS